MAHVTADASDSSEECQISLAGMPQTMGIPIAIRGWHGPLCHALRDILSSPPAEAHLFRRVLSHAARYGNDLARDASSEPIGKNRRPAEFPLASLLLAMPARPSALERTLAWLILEAHLSFGYGELVVALAQILRGLVGKGTSKLKDTIARCNGPTRLIAKMGRLEAMAPELGITGHQTFDSLWRCELEAFCVSLVRQLEPDPAEADYVVGVPIDQPSALTENPTEQQGDDPEEGVHFPSSPVQPWQKIRGPRMRHALDWSVHMSRQSSPDLLRPKENVMPADLRRREWQIALARTESALAQCDLFAAQYELAAVLSIECGLNAREASSVGFGSSTAGQIPVIDLAARALRRPELLPPNYFIPDANDDRWLPTGGDVIFPLSSNCTSLAMQLLEAREAQPESWSNHLLLTGSIDKAKLRAATRSQYRLSLAIGIADVLGPDAAQRAFGDSFGLSTAPVFYGSYPALELARTIATVNDFTDDVRSDAPWESVAAHWLGSRVRPAMPPYQKVWVQLQGDGKRSRGRPSDRKVLQEWRQRRDRLAIHFLLATGCRPANSLASMVIQDFLPKDALALVTDKVTDPAHTTRLVCTGWRFTGELESFINELSRVARNSEIVEAKNLASKILSGAAPLFSIPTEREPEPINIRNLLSLLDPLWAHRPNLHRHGLYQFLIQRGVDPELRYFQMGWLSHDHHATSDSAPFPPGQLGRELAGVVDDWLAQCGWSGGRRATAPDTLVPRVCLQDWMVRRKSHAITADAAFAALRAELNEIGGALDGEVWERIRVDAEQVLSSFDATGSSSCPSFQPRSDASSRADEPKTISQLQVEAILASFATATTSAAERYVATKLLHKALLNTAKAHSVRVYLPEVPVLSRYRIPSPFLPGVGLAVAQVDAFKEAIAAHVAELIDISGPKAAADLAAAAVWSIVLQTSYCDLDDVVGLLRGITRSQHSNAEPWLLRVPFRNGHVVLTGDLAVLARRLVRVEGWSDVLEAHARNGFSSLGSFVRKLVPDLCDPRDAAAKIACKMVETARVAGVITLNGAERLILNKIVDPVSTLADRAVAVADSRTVHGGRDARHAPSKLNNECPHTGRNPPHVPVRDISRVLNALNPDYGGEIMGRPAEPVARRHRQVKLVLEDALSKVGATPTVSRLVLEYAWHLLERGGPRSSGGQAISTIYKTTHQLLSVLRHIDADENLEDLASEELTAICRLACETSRRRSSREVLGALGRFFRHIARRYRVTNPDWDILYRTFGVAVPGGDPALVGDLEADRVIAQLYSNLLLLDAVDTDPSEKRYRELCLAAALIAEASGARPRSIHGLTFGDVVLGSECDYIHLRARGRFASIKTRTAAGFIPLEGDIWAKYAPWFANWLNDACATLSPELLDAIPIFQIPGEALGVRYEKKRVFEPIGSLIRWSTQQPRGRTYWMRKRRVRARHLAVQSKAGARARDMARAMRLDGHALILTPVARYLSEPTAYSTLDVGTHVIASRAGAAAITGLPVRQVDRAGPANGIETRRRTAKLLRLGPSRVEDMELPDAPELPRYRSDLTWASLDRILRDLANGNDESWVASRHSAQKQQIESICRAKQALEARLGVRIGTDKGGLGPPRRSGQSSGWFDLLDREDARLIPIADDWVAVAGGGQLDQGCRLYGSQAVGGLAELARELGLELARSELVGGHGVSLIRVVGRSGSVYGAWPVLRWVLAVVWISQHRAMKP